MSSFRRVVKKWWFWPLVVGLLIRFILMPITLHPDLWGHSFAAYFFSYKGVVNIYDHLLNLPLDHPLVKNFGVGDMFIYPPLTYFTLGLFRLLVKPFTDYNFIPWLMQNLGTVHTYRGLYWHLLLFKLPYVFVDIAAAFVLKDLFKTLKAKKLVFFLWIFNPLSLYATFMMGQLDLIPTFFTILALYFASKKRYAWSLFSLGIGGSYKMYPLLLIIPTALVFSDNFKQRIKYILLGFLPFIATIAPYIGSAAFRQMVLFTPKSQKMLYMGLPVSGAEVVFPFPSPVRTCTYPFSIIFSPLACDFQFILDYYCLP